jgi:hypothetical protein
MELHLSGSSGIRQERLLVQEQDKVRALPQLKRDGALMDQAFRLLQECGWENGLVSRGGARHSNHPLRKAVLTATYSPRSLPKKGTVT